jgi:3'-5' exoribonuclease
MPAATESAPRERSPIATLRSEDQVDGVFACTRKERLTSRAGMPYLNLELSDSTGTITGRAFRDADVLAGRFERGQLVRVRGRVVRFREALQLDVRTIEQAAAADADPACFLPVAYRDLDELEGFLEHLVREVYDRPLRQLLDRLLGDRALRTELRRAPCSIPGARSTSVHHAYLGGLLEHTVAVATLALELCALHPRLDRDLLLSAAIVHDIG